MPATMRPATDRPWHRWSACDVLTGAAADLGDVADTAAWREKVGQALRVLQP